MIIFLITALGFGLVIYLTKFSIKGLICSVKKISKSGLLQLLSTTQLFIKRKYTKQVGILFDLLENNVFDLTNNDE